MLEWRAEPPCSTLIAGVERIVAVRRPSHEAMHALDAGRSYALEHAVHPLSLEADSIKDWLDKSLAAPALGNAIPAPEEAPNVAY